MLWVTFPGLNAALAPGSSGELAAVNTVLALAAASVSAFAFSGVVGETFAVAHLQNAVLAGGVGIATTAHLLLKPYSALLLGTQPLQAPSHGWVQ